ncbi:MAG: prohibitin family protein [Candidatus Gottesmanbacteria bacterium]|nr:prohibitin family protein [Candidatus Gottesmanbacteria bacterium]
MTTNSSSSGILSSLTSSFRLIKTIALIIFGLFIFRSTLIFVPAGHVGVVYDSGRGVLPQSMKEGLNFAIPLWQKITLFDTRLQEYTMSASPDEGALRRDDSLDAPTSDGQTVKVDATVLFKVNGEKAPEILKTIGEDYVDKIIRPFSRSQIRMVISRYTAPAIYSEKRQEAETTMTKELGDMLEGKYLILDKVLLRAVYFSPEYSKAIEQKVVAGERVKQAEYEVKEATQRAQAKIAEAKGLAEAQALQKASLTAEYLQLEAIKKWDGKLPQVTGGSSPFINIPLK